MTFVTETQRQILVPAPVSNHGHICLWQSVIPLGYAVALHVVCAQGTIIEWDRHMYIQAWYKSNFWSVPLIFSECLWYSLKIVNENWKSIWMNLSTYKFLLHWKMLLPHQFVGSYWISKRSNYITISKTICQMKIRIFQVTQKWISRAFSHNYCKTTSVSPQHNMPL